jgi:Ca2+/Na+ antiporter
MLVNHLSCALAYISVVLCSATSAMEWEAQLKADRMTGVIFSALSTSLDHVIAFGMVWLLRRNKSEYVQ